MPSKKSPSKGSKKASKGSKGSKGKSSSNDIELIEKSIFGRERYDNMDAVYIKKSTNIVIFAPKIHIYEVWNELPRPQEPLVDGGSQSKSPKGSKASKSPKGSKASKGPKKSPKSSGTKSPKSGGQSQEEVKKPEYERALLIGAVALPKTLLKPEDKVFVEVTADFEYYAYSKVPPYPAQVVSRVRCYKDFYYIYPRNTARPTPFMTFSQDMTLKVHDEYPHGWYMYPFQFDLTRKPDSVFFSRPWHLQNNSGLKWKVRAFAAKTEYCIPPPENEVEMTFYKYTIAPILAASVQRPICVKNYNRYTCIEDQGMLTITARLDRDVYYHGEEITVAVNISNDSARHIVCTVSAYIEQVCRLTSEIPHDYSIPVGGLIIGPGEFGLPVNPKNKGWTKEFTIRPMYERSLYNLAVDGRMSRDNKIFLAESTIIMKAEMVKMEPLPTPVEKSPKGSKNSEGSKGPKGGKKSPKSSKGSKGKKSPKGGTSSPPPPEEENIPPPIMEKEFNTISQFQPCRVINVSYEAVIKCSLRTPMGDEGGTPVLRLPFILCRNSRYIDQLNKVEPPIFSHAPMH